MSPFDLYREETSWWSFADHGTTLSVVRRLRPRTVLEFGPGSSTLALIEGGAERIDCCEDDPVWFTLYCHRLEDVYPRVVRMRPYQWSSDLRIQGLRDTYDMALIDGPRALAHRPAAIRFAAARCTHLLIPLEEGEPNHLRSHIDALGRPVEYVPSGPLAGTFALVGPAC